MWGEVRAVTVYILLLLLLLLHRLVRVYCFIWPLGDCVKLGLHLRPIGHYDMRRPPAYIYFVLRFCKRLNQCGVSNGLQ